MRIKHLRIADIRAVDLLQLSHLPTVIVLAGPNGSGKSTVLDAIRAFKAAHATAVTDFVSGDRKFTYSFGNVAKDYPNLVSVGADEGLVDLVLSLSMDEKAHLETERDELSGRVVFRPGGASPRLESPDSAMLVRLFGDFPKRMEHIPASRRFRPHQLGSIDLSPDWHIQERLRFSDQTDGKFEDFKRDLLYWDYQDSKAAEGGEGRMQAIRLVLSEYLDGKEFVGIELPPDAAPRITIRDSRGSYEIDDLSSGEKEILMTLGSLSARRHENSIILWDEPDLHLHGSAETRLPQFIDRLSEHDNQIWVGTHSPEVINAVGTDDRFLVRMPGGEAGSNIGQRVTRHDERVETLEAIGASLYVQTVFRKIVWHEGPSDSLILRAFEPELEKVAAFISAGGGAAISQIAPHMAELVQSALKDSVLIAIRDRDSEIVVTGETGTAKARLFTWSRREIENYLLDPESIVTVHQSFSLPEQPSTGEVDAELRSIADGRLPWIITKTLERRVNQILRATATVTLYEKDAKGSLLAARLELTTALDSDISETRAKLLHDKVDKEIRDQWQESWRELCPGKQVLIEFHRRHVHPHISYSQYCVTLARTMARENRVPEDVAAVIAAIEA